MGRRSPQYPCGTVDCPGSTSGAPHCVLSELPKEARVSNELSSTAVRILVDKAMVLAGLAVKPLWAQLDGICTALTVVGWGIKINNVLSDVGG
jgi:hypothetical protein